MKCHQDKIEKNMWKEAQDGRHQSNGGKVKKWEVLQNWRHQSKSGKRRNEWGTGVGHTKAAVKKLTTHNRHRKGKCQIRSKKGINEKRCRKEKPQYKWEDKLKTGNSHPPSFHIFNFFHSGISYWGPLFNHYCFHFYSGVTHPVSLFTFSLPLVLVATSCSSKLTGSFVFPENLLQPTPSPA